MVAAIHKGLDKSYFVIELMDGDSIYFDVWRERYGDICVETKAEDLYNTMSEIFQWFVDEMNEMCVFYTG